jgi:phosphohistidine phosphatase SixA
MNKYALIPLLSALVVVAAYGQPPSPSNLLPELRKGGYILYMRHPKTNPDQADTDPLHLDNVKAQRQLSAEGRQQAKSMGEAFRAQKIPVEKVISSKFYRAYEAAKLLDVGEVTTTLDVSEGGLVVSPNENERRTKALRQLLATPPPAGKNLIIVSHKPNLLDAAGQEFGNVGEGGVVVFQALADGKFKAVARVAPAEWAKWAK